MCYRESRCLPGNCKRSKNSRVFFPPERALLCCSSAHRNRGRSGPLLQQRVVSCAAPQGLGRSSLLSGRILLWEQDLTPVLATLCV